MADDPSDDEPRRSRRSRREDRYESEYDDEYEEERPRRRRRRRANDEDYDERGDTTGGLIPYKNGMALAAYYCAIVGLIPPLGMVLGVLALIFGIAGLKHKSQHPRHGGSVHAIVGIVLGCLSALGYWVLLILMMTGTRLF